MSSSNDVAAFDFGGPATYRIVVQGTVSEDWSGRLGEMEITTSSQESVAPQSVLLGRIRDQGALRGILEILYALHLPILEITKLDDRCESEPETTNSHHPTTERTAHELEEKEEP